MENQPHENTFEKENFIMEDMTARVNDIEEVETTMATWAS